MRDNPELARLLWTELTPHRLVAVPAIIGALVLLAALVSDSSGVGIWAALGSGGLLGLWGARLAAGSVADEAANRTWDGQRLSALGPWEMTWGKLVGSTAVAWYGGLICLAVYLAASAGSVSGRKLALTASSLVAGAIFCQGVGMLAALLELRRSAAASRRSRGAGGAVLAFLLYYVFVMAATGGSAPSGTVRWFDLRVGSGEFLLASVACFAAWSVVGAWRVMREELQAPGPPVAWAAFFLFFAVYVAGTPAGERGTWALLLGSETDTVTARLAAALVAGLALLYFAAIVEAKDAALFRRLLVRRRAEGTRAVLADLPCWMASLPLVLAAAAAAAAIPAAGGAGRGPAILALSALGFAARDLGLLLAFNLGPNPRRADAAALLYWGVLYGVLPALAGQLGGGGARFLFYPQAQGAAAVVAPALEAAAVLILLRRRWRGAVTAGPVARRD